MQDTDSDIIRKTVRFEEATQKALDKWRELHPHEASTDNAAINLILQRHNHTEEAQRLGTLKIKDLEKELSDIKAKTAAFFKAWQALGLTVEHI